MAPVNTEMSATTQGEIGAGDAVANVMVTD